MVPDGPCGAPRGIAIPDRRAGASGASSTSTMTSVAHFDLACTATALYVHPVKACAPLAVDELVLDARGAAAGDREWAVVDAEGAVTWQGAYARLALVHPAYEGAGLRLRAAGHGDIATPPTLAPRRVKIWSDLAAAHEEFDATDAGDAVAGWLSGVVGAPLRLVRLGGDALARAGNNALHLVFSPSVAAVDADLAAQGRGPADPRRYRPNIVLSMPPGDAGVEFIEESLEALEWPQGDATLPLPITAPCLRCPVPNVDPASAEVDVTVGDTLARLARARRADGAVVFGVYARGPAGARLRVGDVAGMVVAF